MKRILVISGDILPYPGFPTTGAGLRAWGIGKGLESRGHEVILAMPCDSAQKINAVPNELVPSLYTYKELSRFVNDWKPDVVIFQHWLLVNFLEKPLDIPVVIDFHGPLLLETQFQDNPVLEKLKWEKIEAIHKADFFTCAGEKQRHYFFPWLLLAGFDLRAEIIASVPVSLSPDLPQHNGQGEPAFVYGGIFLPWQDPVQGLYILVECLEKEQKGILKFFGGKHPVVALPTSRFEALSKQLRQSSRVQMQPMIPRDQLIREYCQAHVAIDIMQRNAERELAFTTRTVEYLWCGLPVIYNDYSELSEYIQTYNAGWTLDPADEKTLKNVIEEILEDPASLEKRSRNAQKLVREQLTWDKTIAPLDAFCRNPVKRAKKTPLHAHKDQSVIKKIDYVREKFMFHLKNEGLKEVIRRGWDKFKRSIVR